MGVVKLLKASEAKAQIFFKDDTLSQSKHALCFVNGLLQNYKANFKSLIDMYFKEFSKKCN